MLHIATTSDECLASAEVRACLEEALRARGAATLLVASFADQLVAQKELSAYPALSLGVTVTTPAAWAKERWEVWGDGTHVVEPLVRTIAVQRAIVQAPQSRRRGVSLNAGTVQLLSSLVRGALPWLPLDPAGEPNELACHEAGLTDAEVGLVALAGEYARVIHDAGYVEESEAMAQVVDALAQGLVDPGCVCVAGLGESSRQARSGSAATTTTLRAPTSASSTTRAATSSASARGPAGTRSSTEPEGTAPGSTPKIEWATLWSSGALAGLAPEPGAFPPARETLPPRAATASSISAMVVP